MFAPKSILVPTDFTGDSDRALKEAVDIAKAFHSKVFLIHVDSRILEMLEDPSFSQSEIEAVEKRDAEIARARMADEIRKVAKETEVDIELAERHGKTHEEILGFGTEKGVDLIVIEPHPKHGLVKTLMGSVVDKLIHHATCAVLVLH